MALVLSQSLTGCLSVPLGPEQYSIWVGKDTQRGLEDQGPMPSPPAVGNSETHYPELMSFVFLTKSKAVKGSLLVFLAGYHPKRKR